MQVLIEVRCGCPPNRRGRQRVANVTDAYLSKIGEIIRAVDDLDFGTELYRQHRRMPGSNHTASHRQAFDEPAAERSLARQIETYARACHLAQIPAVFSGLRPASELDSRLRRKQGRARRRTSAEYRNPKRPKTSTCGFVLRRRSRSLHQCSQRASAPIASHVRQSASLRMRPDLPAIIALLMWMALYRRA
jgi:hypothetical protein